MDYHASFHRNLFTVIWTVQVLIFKLFGNKGMMVSYYKKIIFAHDYSQKNNFFAFAVSFNY